MSSTGWIFYSARVVLPHARTKGEGVTDVDGNTIYKVDVIWDYDEMISTAKPNIVLVHIQNLNKNHKQGCDRYKDFVSPNQIQNQIGLVLFVRPDTRDDMSQPWT